MRLGRAQEAARGPGRRPKAAKGQEPRRTRITRIQGRRVPFGLASWMGPPGLALIRAIRAIRGCQAKALIPSPSESGGGFQPLARHGPAAGCRCQRSEVRQPCRRVRARGLQQGPSLWLHLGQRGHIQSFDICYGNWRMSRSHGGSRLCQAAGSCLFHDIRPRLFQEEVSGMPWKCRQVPQQPCTTASKQPAMAPVDGRVPCFGHLGAA